MFILCFMLCATSCFWKSGAATFNKNEQQQDAKAMLNYRPNGRKTTWKTFEDTVRRGWNGSFNP